PAGGNAGMESDTGRKSTTPRSATRAKRLQGGGRRPLDKADVMDYIAGAHNYPPPAGPDSRRNEVPVEPDDVPAVLRLGRLVRHPGKLSWGHARGERLADRARLRNSVVGRNRGALHIWPDSR